MLTAMEHALGHITADSFLTEYWQNKPLLVRQAIKNVSGVIDAKTLAGLSLEPSIRSRIVLSTDTATDWECRYGPFEETDYEQLPAGNWTLLVQDVDKHIPKTAELLEYFSFLPRWRIDDLMISYAVDGGSVGPHTDQYDVFLLQTHGQRKWLLQIDDVDENNLLENIELQLLKNFVPQEEYILNPGDMLYLPPGIAHHGIAMGECITYSIGFRAPSQADLLQAFTEQYSLHNNNPEFYRDQDPVKAARGELRQSDINTMRELLVDAMDDKLNMTRAIGNLLTNPTETPSLDDTPTLSLAEFIDLLDKTSRLKLHPAARCVYIRDKGAITLYVNTNEYRFGPEMAPVLTQLCDEYILDEHAIESILTDHTVIGLLQDLYQQGYLYLENKNT